MLALCALGRAVAADTLETVQRTAVEWAKLREEKVRLEQDWSHERELLQVMIPAVQERLQILEDKRKLTEEQTAAARREAEVEGAKSAALSSGMEKAQDRLRQVSRELLQLRPALPPRLSQALVLAFESVADEKLGPAERMRAVVTVLDRCAQFNAAITLSEEVVLVPGDKENVMEVLYWGLAQAYALDRSGRKAYVGRPGEKGWSWEPRPDAVKNISAAIAAYRDEANRASCPSRPKLPRRIQLRTPLSDEDFGDHYLAGCGDPDARGGAL